MAGRKFQKYRYSSYLQPGTPIYYIPTAELGHVDSDEVIRGAQSTSGNMFLAFRGGIRVLPAADFEKYCRLCAECTSLPLAGQSVFFRGSWEEVNYIGDEKSIIGNFVLPTQIFLKELRLKMFTTSETPGVIFNRNLTTRGKHHARIACYK